jgi:predicted PurR-regulated permease PerM
MKKLFCIVIVLFFVGISGCGNFNPKNNPRINNQNGSIEEIKSNQNGIISEIGKIKQSAEIQNSKLKEVQDGLININNAISRNENSGIQILQGDGALIMVFSLIVIAMLLWYRDRAIKNEKAAKIMAKEIAKINDPVINDNVLRAAILDNTESHVYNMLSQQRKNMI